nr:puromycin-sensitive aminopeptidase [Quercus suber]
MAAANAGRINHVEPGPIDTSVLQQQANHRSEAIWNRQDPGTLTCRSRSKEFSNRAPMVDDRVVNIIKALGLEGLLWLPVERGPPVGAYGPPVRAPLSLKWLWVPNKKNRPANIFRDRYREQIASMLPDQVVWQPYEAEFENLPPWCVAGRAVWTATVPLVGVDWMRKHAVHIGHWGDRLQRRFEVVLGEMPPDHEYFGWFNRVTRRFIDRPGAKLTMLVSLVNRLLRHHPVGTEEHTDINDVLTAVHHIDRVQPPIPEAPNEEAASPAGPSTTEGPSTSTTPTGCPSPQPVATPPSLSTPDPSPYTPHPSPSLTISSPIPHPSPSLTIPSSIPHPFPSPVIPPPTLQEFLELSPIPSLNLGIGPTPPHMQQEPPSHNMPIGPSSAIDPPLVEPDSLAAYCLQNQKLIAPSVALLPILGMDLYFKRHDGQAVTCEDFFAAMRDANDADFANFLQWYSQAGTPLVKVTSSYDPKARTFSLKFCQEVPPTPGQPVKEPMFIPVALGLLDSTGKDIPLSSVYHDGTLQSVSSNDQPLYTIVLRVTKKEEEFVFSDISERPVPSLLRGYSSPIRLESDLTDSNLSFLLAHDSDEFNRWEAA